MHRLPTALLSLACAATFVAPALAQKGKRDEAFRYGWTESLSAAKRAAKNSGKPIMVVVRCVP